MNFALPFRDERSIGFLASALLHAALFLLGGFILSTPIEYAVESGSGGIEVNLVAAPAEDAAVKTATMASVEETAETAETETVPSESKPEETQAKAAVSAHEAKEDGSSLVPGKDLTTFQSAGGALTDAKPNYLRNPAPAYPAEARQKGQEGLVVLRVRVGRDGSVSRIALEGTSGHELLDRSAYGAVAKWRFLPAETGGIPVESEALVPVRFSLKD